MSCQKSAMPAPPSTTSARTRMRNCLRFTGSYRLCPLAAPAQRQTEPGQSDQQRHQADVENLGPEFQLIGIDPEFLPELLEIAAGFGSLLAEVLELDLLFRRQNGALGTALGLLQGLQVFLRLV